ncbi:MAG: MOSC domain-containing protein [Nitrospirota bacterium]|jgi:MOSC domain-containing protein YiiM
MEDVLKGKVIAVSISEKKGERKKNVDKVFVKENFGLEGDAHASGKWHRQVSLLAIESVDKMRKLGLNVNPGDFAENLTIEGIDLAGLPIGTRLNIGSEVEMDVSQIGKVCHERCNIYYQAGDCVMPREGIFAKVIKSGWVKPGDEVIVMTPHPSLSP